MAGNSIDDAVNGNDRCAIDSWEDEGGALKNVPPKVVPREFDRLAMLGLVAVVSASFYFLARVLISVRNRDES